MKKRWERVFEDAADEISNVRRDLGNFDSRVLAIKGAEKDSILRAKAATYVWLPAITEKFVVGWVAALCAEFNSREVSWCDVRLSLFSMACGSDIQSIADGVKKNVWDRKVSMFSLTANGDVAKLDKVHAPLDGRTIRPSHLEDIWRVFGFIGSPFPTLMHRSLLEAIANYRNNISHGSEMPAVFGAQFTYKDVQSHISRTEDLLEHLIVASENYFSKRHYLR